MTNRTGLQTKRSSGVWLALCFTWLMTGSGPLVTAGLAPENIVVLVNADSWMSHSVANTYVALRGIPAGNVIALQGIPTGDSMRISDFRQKILTPVFAEIARRGLVAQIDAVVYSTDFPYAVDFREDFRGKKAPRFVGTRAAITGLTYLYQSVLEADLDYADRGSNWYSRRVVHESTDVPWDPSDREAYGGVERFFMERAKRKKDLKEATDEAKQAFEQWEKAGWQEAEAVMRRLGGLHPDAPHVQYNLACAQSMCGKLDDAIASLRQAFSAGYRDWHHMGKDSDLAALRDRKDFKDLTEEMLKAPVTMNPPKPFSARVGWTPGGNPVPRYKGGRYLISTMLGYTSGRGNSYREVVQSLERAAGADGTRPDGAIHFMLNRNLRSTTREWAVRPAADQIRALGIDARVEQGVLPKEATVAGVFVGTASFKWGSSKSTIVPGAICEHLTSCGGILREKGSQTPLTAFIRAGAAGASGTVVEPFAIQAKFPHAFLQTYYATGYTLGEAFYLSVLSPYQLLIVGDPLCRPWASVPEVVINGLLEAGPIKAPVSVTVDVSGPSPKRVEFHIDGRLVRAAAPGETFEFDPASLAVGDHRLSVVTVRAHETESRGRAVAEFQVARSSEASPGLAVDVSSPVDIGGEVAFSWKATGVSRIAVLHHGKRLADIAAKPGGATLPAAGLGLGTAELVIVGANAEGKPVVSVKETVVVGEPPSLPCSDHRWEALAKGVHLKGGNGKTATVETLSGGWLTKAGFAEGDTVAIDAIVQASDDDLYQFQIFGNVPVVDGLCRVDGRTFAVFTAGPRRGFPVVLQKGTHSVRLTVQVPAGKPSLRICFGNRGTQVLGESNCRHAAGKPAQETE